MSTIIKDTAGNVVDLPTDFQTDMEITSPIFEPTGSGSLPIVLPSSPANDIRFGYAANSGRAAHPTTRIDVTVNEDNSIRTGVLALAEVTDTGDYDCSILFDESDFYGKIAETNLGDITGLPVVGGGAIDSLVTSLKAVYQNFESFDGGMYLISDWMHEVNVYPVIVSKEDDATMATPEKYRWMNEPNFSVTGATVYPLIGETAYTVSETKNGTTSVVNYPKGYSIVPFIKLHRAIHYVMQYCGYTVVENVFATDSQLSKANLLNNIMDIICDGVLNFADMMPDCTISDFMQMLKARFGAFVFINSTDKTARIKLFKDLKNSTPTDITSLKGGKAKITIPTKKALKLSAGKSFAPTKTSHDTYEDFLKRWDSIIPEVTSADVVLEPERIRQYLVYRLKNTGCYYLNSPVNPMAVDEYYSSPYFNFVQKNTQEFEEWTSPDEQLAMENYSHYLVAPLYLAGRRHKKTVFVGVSDIETDGENSTPLSLCFSKGRGKYLVGDTTYMYGTDAPYYYGSILAYNNIGSGKTPSFYFDLIYQGEMGLFNVFLKDYDAMLRAAFESHTQIFNLPAIQRNTFDTSRPLLVDNQLFLPEKLTWTTGKLSTEVLMRSMRLLHDVMAEQPLYSILYPLYKWVAWNNLASIIAAAGIDVVASMGAEYLIRHEILTQVSPSEIEFKFLRYPTESQYQTQLPVTYDYPAQVLFVVFRAGVAAYTSRDLTYQSGVIAALI